MTRLRAFASFLYDFVIGDDPLIAMAVALALGVIAALSGQSVQAWWLGPAAVVLVLGDSVRRAARDIRPSQREGLEQPQITDPQ